MQPHELTPQLFLILAGLVEDRVGLHYGPHDRDVFAAKVTARAMDAGFHSLMDYYYRLRYDDPAGEELTALIDGLLVHETYLFREADALEVVADELAARAATGPAERPAVWSAACATGEEPLTLAMMLAERGALDDVRIVASDVSERALARARRGLLGPRAVRDPARMETAERWVRRRERGWQVAPELVDRIDWQRVNLVDEDAVAAFGPAAFDVVVLRNVLIYFTDDTVRRVVRNVGSVLRPAGFLVLGASESVMRLGTGLRLEERRGAFVYSKPVTS